MAQPQQILDTFLDVLGSGFEVRCQRKNGQWDLFLKLAGITLVGGTEQKKEFPEKAPEKRRLGRPKKTA